MSVTATLDDITIRLQPLQLRASIEAMAQFGWTVRSIFASGDNVLVTFKPPKLGRA